MKILTEEELEDLIKLSSQTDTKKEPEEEDEIDEFLYTQWLFQNGSYTAIGKAEFTEALKPGYYTVVERDYKMYVRPIDPCYDKVTVTFNKKLIKIKEEITQFWNKKQLFKDYKMTFKRGILLTGHPGTGKSTLINMLAEELVKENGIVFYIGHIADLYRLINFAKTDLKTIQPQVNMITIIEDIDVLYKQDSTAILNFLNGNNQLENNLVIATTNRLHELDDLILRPSRFDWVVEVEKPTIEERFLFFLKKGLDKEESNLFASKTDEFSYAELKEIFISVKLFDNNIDIVVKKLKDQSKNVTTTFQGMTNKTAGFSIKGR